MPYRRGPRKTYTIPHKRYRLFTISSGASGGKSVISAPAMPRRSWCWKGALSLYLCVLKPLIGLLNAFTQVDFGLPAKLGEAGHIHQFTRCAIGL